MKILFLEDDANRIATARGELIGDWVTVVETAGAAIRALQSDSFDVASLDHDLGGRQMADSDENSGYAVAKFIAEMDTPPSVVIVHSFNPVGAQRMTECLHDAKVETWRQMFGTVGYWDVLNAWREELND